ncbi:TEA/ATTS domain family-domain-containing protein [Delphinella strobiligena]|nr:TEA/ATTS domain family-domain-containing protein [Delphinella strobiligena]
MIMEVYQPTPILPSNAPPWAGVSEEDETTQLQVLQEQCGNRQLGFLPSQRCASTYNADDESDTDDCSPMAALDSHLGHRAVSYPQPHASEYRYPNSLYENNYSSMKHDYCVSNRLQGHRRGVLGETNEAKEERKREAAARRLASLFAQCEGYIKYRNRQPKEGKGKDDQKWPEHMEDAFLRALVRWPPVGRKKHTPRAGVKQMGRNELIADYIYMATGEVRTRKQVSSHIQVLKPFVQGEPDIMHYLSDESKNALGPSQHATMIARRQASMYPIKSHVERRGAKQLNLYDTFNLELEEFKMYMRTPEHIDPPPKTLHTYTTYNAHRSDGRLQDSHIQDTMQLQQAYPELASLQSSRVRRGRFIAIEATLALHDPAQVSTNQIELAISYAFQGPASCPSPRVACRTRMYKNGVREDISKSTAYDDIPVTPTKDAKGDTRNQYVVLNFRSTFWAPTIWRLARDQQTANILATRTLEQNETLESRQAQISAIRESVQSSLRGITAVQEFVVATPSRSGGTQVVLTIHWSFRQAREGEAGTTAWRNLFLPGAVDQQRSLSPLAQYDLAAPARMDPFDASLGSLGVAQGGVQTFDFSQPVGGYCITNSVSESNEGIVGLSTLQSPISFAADSGAANANGHNTWNAANDDALPSTTFDVHQPRNYQYAANDSDFTGGRIAMTFTDDSQDHAIASAPQGHNFDTQDQVYNTSQEHHYSIAQDHQYESQDQYLGSHGLPTDLHLDGVHTDPLLFQSFGTGNAPWGTTALHAHSESFFDVSATGTTAGPAASTLPTADDHGIYMGERGFTASVASMVGLSTEDDQNDHTNQSFEYNQSYAQQPLAPNHHSHGHSPHLHSHILDFEIPFPPYDMQYHSHDQAFPGATSTGHSQRKQQDDPRETTIEIDGSEEGGVELDDVPPFPQDQSFAHDQSFPQHQSFPLQQEPVDSTQETTVSRCKVSKSMRKRGKPSGYKHAASLSCHPTILPSYHPTILSPRHSATLSASYPVVLLQQYLVALLSYLSCYPDPSPPELEGKVEVQWFEQATTLARHRVNKNQKHNNKNEDSTRNPDPDQIHIDSHYRDKERVVPRHEQK